MTFFFFLLKKVKEDILLITIHATTNDLMTKIFHFPNVLKSFLESFLLKKIKPNFAKVLYQIQMLCNFGDEGVFSYTKKLKRES